MFAKFLSFVISVFLVTYVCLASIQKVRLEYNQERFQAYIINNTSYLSKEDLSYIIGSPIKWDSSEKVVIIDNLRIYAKVAIYKGQMLLAIKEILTPLGYQVKWNQLSRAITILPPGNQERESKVTVKVEKNQENKDTDSKYQIPLIEDKNNKKSKDGEDKNIKTPEQSIQVVFIPRSAFNEEYKVTVSDLKETKVYKSMYNAQDGHKFVVISVSQQNLSNKVQLYTGRFVLFDNKNMKYDYIEGLSSYVLQILMPMGINFGTIVFEIPEESIPSKLVLETYGSTPIVVSLI
ncbi:MAG: hypothetical protein ABDH21_00235 [bacterium]